MSVFKGNYYQLEIVTPTYIGGAKENDYLLGQDFFIDNGEFLFYRKNELLKQFSIEDIQAFSSYLIQNKTDEISILVKKKCHSHPELVLKKLKVIINKPEIRKHIADGMGNLIIPGSTLKGAIRSIIGVDKFIQPERNDFNFGPTTDNLMRLIQITDATFSNEASIVPIKVYSGDIEGEYRAENQGKGTWKDASRGGHKDQFNDSNFVTLFESLRPNDKGICRISFADELLKLINNNDKTTFINTYKHEKIIKLIQNHTNKYLNAEIKYFEKFSNQKFSNVIEHLNKLIEINKQDTNSALIRIGSGTGFHGITGNWKYADNHSQTDQAEEKVQGRQNEFRKINAIKYKTRKVAFSKQNGNVEFQLPGFVKITLLSDEGYKKIEEEKIEKIKKEKQSQLDKEKALLEIENAKKLALLEEQKKLEKLKQQQQIQFNDLVSQAELQLQNDKFTEALKLYQSAVNISDDGSYKDFENKVNLICAERENQLYIQSQTINSLEAYNEFLQKFPLSSHKQEIESNISKLKALSGLPEKFFTMKSFEDYEKQFPQWLRRVNTIIEGSEYENEVVSSLKRLFDLEKDMTNIKGKAWREGKNKEKITKWIGENIYLKIVS